MEQTKTMQFPKIPKAVWLVGGFCLLQAALFVLVYYWRVFYYLDARDFPIRTLNLGLFAFGAVLYGVAMLLCSLKNVPLRAALAVFVAGLVFVFANPPLQTPDEQLHFLRTYAISEGYFDFDLLRAYPESVDVLVDAFPGAWVNAHTSQGMRENDGGDQETYDSSGYALKQYGEDGVVTGVADAFATYFIASEDGAAAKVQEPLSFVILPYLPAALGMAIARLFGMAALGSLYAGRVANLLCYTLLCYLAFKNAKQYRTVFVAIAMLPISLYMAASLNYDAILLGLYWVAFSFFAKDWRNGAGLTKCDFIVFFAVFVGMSIIKPWISLLFLGIIFALPATAWANRTCQTLKKWQYGIGCVSGAVLATVLVAWYGNAFRSNYPVVERMLGNTVNGGEQLVFILSNPLRYLAVMVGTLYENDLFLGQMGLFGSLDMPITFISMVSPFVLLLAAMLGANRTVSLRPLPALGLGTLSVCYIGALLSALYITYTPVGMVRIIGLQARYFLPVFLMFAILLCAGLSRLLQPNAKPEQGEDTAFWISAVFGVLGGMLLFQHYFIGPVYTI